MLNETITDIVFNIKKELSIYRNQVSPQMNTLSSLLYDSALDLSDEEKNELSSMLISELNQDEPYCIIWWYSVLLSIEKKPDSIIRIISYLDNHQKDFSLNTLYFLIYQVKGFIFMHPESNSVKVRTLLWKLYRDVSNNFKSVLSLERIPYEKRNHNLIVFITGQVISTQHGPTKTAFDRCIAVQNGLGKQVLLINTAEVLTVTGYIPFFGTICGSYMESKINEEFQEWKGNRIPYFQCNNNMPDLDTISMLMDYLKKLAPERIISIGGISIVGDMANCLVPTLTLGLGPSDIDITMADYQTLSRPLKAEDLQMLKEIGYDESHIINSIFTSGLKTQEEHITKDDLDIDGKFLVSIVGARLAADVKEDFLDMLEEIIDADTIIGFFGYFENYSDIISKRPHLANNTRYFGMCDDILSRMEVTDLYVNPTRLGGGTSCVEAMYKGVPVVTVNYGDVSVNAGPDFCVSNYDEMKQLIQRYKKDQEFYRVMSEKALQRSALLLDTQSEFIRILSEVEKRERA